MMEMDFEDQISGLLGRCLIKEAREIFISRSKNIDNYMLRMKRFNLDAGW